MKLSATVLFQLMTDAINNSISKRVFPDNAKVASVFPGNKKLNDKNKVSNLRPISGLKFFSKTCESVIKYQLISV